MVWALHLFNYVPVFTLHSDDTCLVSLHPFRLLSKPPQINMKRKLILSNVIFILDPVLFSFDLHFYVSRRPVIWSTFISILLYCSL
jgi:hypothetical protein